MYPRCLSILLCGVLSVSAGCSEDANPPRIISISPPPDVINASRGRIVLVQFNEELRENSISDDTIVVEYDGVPLPGTVNFEPSVNAISFEAAEPTLFLRKYDVKLGSGIADREGNAITEDSLFSFLDPNGFRIETDSEWSFRVADGVFSAITQIEPGNSTGNSSDPQVVYGPQGHGQIIWSQSDGTRINIWSRAVRNLQLGSSVRVEDDDDDQTDGDVDTGDASSPQIAIDNDGNAIAVWAQSDGTRTRIYANRFAATGSWSKTPLAISANVSDAAAPQIAIGPNGNAIATWTQSDGRVYASHYTGTWSTAAPIDANTGTATTPQIVIDASNNAIAVWAQNNRIYENRHVANAWGTASPVDDGTGTATAAPQIAIDPDGDTALVVWSQSDNTGTSSIWANRFDGSVWGTAAAVESDSGNVNTPQIAMNRSGKAVAVWTQTLSSRFRIRSSQFIPGSGWDAPVTIDNFDSRVFIDAISEEGISTKPQVALDDDGNVIAVWITQWTVEVNNVDRTFIHTGANRYRGPVAHEDLRGWTGAGLIRFDETLTGAADNPQIALAPDLTGIAIWSKAITPDSTSRVHIHASAFN